MAESVDALVSNTNGAIRAGSIPALGTEKQEARFALPVFFCFWKIDERGQSSILTLLKVPRRSNFSSMPSLSSIS